MLRDSESRNPVPRTRRLNPARPRASPPWPIERYPAPAACPLTPVTTGRTGRRSGAGVAGGGAAAVAGGAAGAAAGAAVGGSGRPRRNGLPATCRWRPLARPSRFRPYRPATALPPRPAVGRRFSCAWAFPSPASRTGPARLHCFRKNLGDRRMAISGVVRRPPDLPRRRIRTDELFVAACPGTKQLFSGRSAAK